MNTIARALAVSLAVGVDAHLQAPPDFSGTWRLDPSRSAASAHADTPGPITLVIAQSPTDIRIETTTSKGTTKETFRFAGSGAVLGLGSAIARWKGDALVTEAIRDIRGMSVTVQQTCRLIDGEMIVESVVNVQHGYSTAGAKVYGSSKDVYVRSH